MLTTTRNAPHVDDRRFFTGMSLAALTVVFLGFATSYYLWPITRATHYPAGQPISPSLPFIVHLHAVLFSLWILLLVTQARLVARGRVNVHRRLGAAAAWLIPIIVITGLATAVQGARDGWNPGGPYPDALSFMVVGVADIAVFLALASAGLALRHRPDLHKRLMVLATLGILWPAITRMPIVAGNFLAMLGLFSMLVLAPAARDFLHRAQYRWVSLFVGLAIVASLLLRPSIGRSGPWHAIATWLVG